jgi:Cu/Ag efflux pump CusA
MVGGMVPSALMTLVVIPVIHALVKQPCPAPTD